jgi:2-succinyl-5-enolpyruvyl-6-hydroxy-3-cyclohexene-1-carboxylate synthase
VLPKDTPYPNNLWSAIFVDQLARAGLQAVCIAPGSRSTPLTLAFDYHPDIKVYLHLDERSAAFFALGLAQATGRPVAVVCTSGTAAAEFHPAIVEAYQAQVPLIVLTADRPPELRDSGANQTIDQVKMYGDHVLWAVDAPLPQADAPAVTVRSLRTLAGRASAIANGLQKGPVHINLPFRKPLEPDRAERLFDYRNEAAAASSLAHMERGILQPSQEQVAHLAGLIRSHERGLIVCGPYCPRGNFPALVSTLAAKAGYPIFADPLSGVRFGPHLAGDDHLVVGGYESFLARGEPPWPAPALVLRFGVVPTSNWLNSYLERSVPAHVIHVHESGVWADDSHRVTDFLQADAALVCHQLCAHLEENHRDHSWLEAILARERAVQAAQQAHLEEDFIDASIIPALLELLADGANLVMGNSLPVRHVDQFGPPSAREIHLYGNRGASGIDGVTSTALGIAAADRSRPTVLLIGDISFYHDMNGLLAVGQHAVDNIVIVLFNNDGGGIFRRLPVSKFQSSFTPLFLTPHGLAFEHVARLYGLSYTQAGDTAAFREHFTRALRDRRAAILEVRTDGDADEARRREIVSRIRD